MPHPTGASSSRCPVTTPGLVPGVWPDIEGAVMVDLTCGLLPGHHSVEHYDLEHRLPWLHPDDPDPAPRGFPSIPED